MYDDLLNEIDGLDSDEDDEPPQKPAAKPVAKPAVNDSEYYDFWSVLAQEYFYCKEE